MALKIFLAGVFCFLLILGNKLTRGSDYYDYYDFGVYGDDPTEGPATEPTTTSSRENIPPEASPTFGPDYGNNEDIAARPTCNVPGDVPNARLLTKIGQMQSFNEGFSLEYQCNAGHRHIGTSSSECVNRQWTEVTCVARPCAHIPHPENGRRLDMNRLFGLWTNFECNKGYKMTGPKRMLCRSSGEWRPSKPPICNPVTCPSIWRLTDGNSFQETIKGRKNIYSSIITFTCDDGFELIGSKDRRCQADGTWSGVQPACEAPSCPDFPPLANGEIFYTPDADRHIFGHTAEIACNDDSDLFPRDFDGFSTCGLNVERVWTHNNFRCNKQCTIPKGRDAKKKTSGRRNRNQKVYKSEESVIHGEIVEKDCDYWTELFYQDIQAYAEINTFTSTCTMGQWSKPQFPTCKNKRCQIPWRTGTHFILNGKRLSYRDKVEHGSVLTKECDDRYEDLPNPTVSCDRGILSGDQACTPKRCIIPKGRDARGYRKTYSSEQPVSHEETVKKTCTDTEELFYPEDDRYAEIRTFSSTCEYGQWSNTQFPICRNRRCEVRTLTGTTFKFKGRELQDRDKVEDGSILTKECDDDYEDLQKQRVECNSGTLSGSRGCSPKRCLIPKERDAKGTKKRRGKTYSSEDPVIHGEIVEKRCFYKKELFFPKDNRYTDSTTFKSECEYGQWSKIPFPTCKNKRCKIRKRTGTKFLYNGQELADKDKVEDGSILTKKCDNGYEDLNNQSVTCNSGTLRGDGACKPKSCLFPAIPNSEKNGEEQKLQHNQQITLMCKTGYKLHKSGNNIIKTTIRTKCVLGNLSRNIEQFTCEPKKCMATSNGVYHRTDNSGEREPGIPPGNVYNNGDFASVECKQNYVLTENNEPILDNTTRISKCELGEWRPKFRCDQDICTFTLGEDQFIDVNGDFKKGKTELPSGAEVLIQCRQNYFLYNKEKTETYDSYPISCKSKQLTAPLPICIKRCELKVQDGTVYKYFNQSAIISNVNIAEGQQIRTSCSENYTLLLQGSRVEDTASQTCKDGNLLPPYSCVLGYVEENVDYENLATTLGVSTTITTEVSTTTTTEDKVTQQTKDKVTQQTKKQVVAESDSREETTVVASTTTITMVTTEEDYLDYYYRAIEDSDDEDSEGVQCEAPANAEIKKFYRSSQYYRVICNDGFKIKNDLSKKYRCQDGKLLSELDHPAVCIEDDCRITESMIRDMEVFIGRIEKRVHFSGGYKVNPGQFVYFNCKRENAEPRNRRYKCIKGELVAAERDRNWNIVLNKTHSTCRPAKCGTGCKFGGTCIKDSVCQCTPGSRGDFCEKPICNAACETNGGACVAPNTCKCKEPQYGTDCEIEGCSRPIVPDGVSFDGDKTAYKIDEKLANSKIKCPDRHVPSMNRDLICRGNNTWSEEIHCIEGAVYILTFTVGTSQWDGSWKTLFIAFGDLQGRTSEKGLFKGKTYTVEFVGRYIKEIQQMELNIDPVDNIFITRLQLTVKFGPQPDEYVFSNVGNVSGKKKITPDPGCLPPDTNIVLLNPKEKYMTGHTLSSQNVQCEDGRSLSPESVTCRKDGSWTGQIHCVKIATYSLKMTLGRDKYAGSGDDLFVSIAGALGMTRDLPLPRIRRNRQETYEYALKQVYLGKITRLDISRNGFNNIQLDTVHLTVTSNNNVDKYVFTEVGWIGRKISVQPDPGCQFEESNVVLLKQQARYMTGDQISSRDVQCGVGQMLSQSVTCLKNGKWSGHLLCLKDAKYSLRITLGSHRYAGSDNDLYVSFSGGLADTDYYMLPRGRRNKKETYVHNVNAGYVGQIRELFIRKNGDNAMEIAIIRLTVSNDNDIDEYIFTQFGWVSNEITTKQPDPGCPHPSPNVVVHPPRDRYLTYDKLTINEVTCRSEEYSTRTVEINCLNSGRWDGTLCEAKSTRYIMEIKAFDGTRHNVHIVINGQDGTSESLVFGPLKPGQKVSQSWDIPNVGEVSSIDIINSGKYRDPLSVKYIWLRTEQNGYMAFFNGDLSGITEVNTSKLFHDGCDGFGFTPVQNGYSKHRFTHESNINSKEDCLKRCQLSTTCKIVVFRAGRQHLCYLIDRNEPGSFSFGENYISEVYFRKC